MNTKWFSAGAIIRNNGGINIISKKFLLPVLVLFMVVSIVYLHRNIAVFNPDADPGRDTGEDSTGNPPGEPEDPANGEEQDGGSADPVTYDPENIDMDYLKEELAFLQNPIPGTIMCHDNYLPNAPRPYRNGFHEGIDFYSWARGGEVSRGTEVRAASSGIIIRIDHRYEDIAPADFERYMEISRRAETTPEDILDLFRGRQVWIEHETGVVTRYCHLDDVVSNLKVNDYVLAGTVIGTVGTTGTREPVRPHLHFEIRIGPYFLGQGMTVAQIRELFQALLFNE